MDEYGVLRGRVCPRCGVADAVRVVPGLPDAGLARAAERGLVVLAGCLVTGDQPAFHCRGCGHDWGSLADPTTDEQTLADLLAVGYDDVVRAVGTDWRSAGVDDAGVTWFLSGDPAQVALGVDLGAVTVAPVAAVHDLTVAWDQGRSFTRDDLLCDAALLARTAEEFARARRRTFRWCPTCRRPHPPEQFSGYRGVCSDCAQRHHGLVR